MAESFTHNKSGRALARMAFVLGLAPGVACNPTRHDANEPSADAGGGSDAKADSDGVSWADLASVPNASVSVFGDAGSDRLYAIEPLANGALLLTGSSSSSGDAFLCDALAGDCGPNTWKTFGDPNHTDWIEALSATPNRLLAVGKVFAGGHPGSCLPSGATDGFVQVWDPDALGVEVECAQYGTAGNDEALAGEVVDDFAFVAGTRAGGADQNAYLTRYALSSSQVDVGGSAASLIIGEGGGSLEEAFWIAVGAKTAAGHRMIYLGGRTAGDLVSKCVALGAAYCTGGPSDSPGAADGWVAGVESDPTGDLTLRWLHQLTFDGKDNIQYGVYVEDAGKRFLLLSGSLHEEHNPTSHGSSCQPFSSSHAEYSDAYLMFLELDGAGDFTGAEAERISMWGESECNTGESFTSVAYESATRSLHVAGSSGGPVDHAAPTGREDGIYFRYRLDLTRDIGALTPDVAVRIRGDSCTDCDRTDRLYGLSFDPAGSVHLIGDTSSTFSQTPWALGPPHGGVDALYVRFTPP